MSAVMVDAPLFSSAWEAVSFAVTRVGAPSRPLMNRMTDATLPDTGLGGLDGAAQAGIIMSALHRLGTVEEAALVAACAPHSLPCACRNPCCSGKRFNNVWSAAISTLCDQMVILSNAGSVWVTGNGPHVDLMLAEDARPRPKSEVSRVEIDRGIRIGVLLKIYNTNLTIVSIATDSGKHVNTVSKYHHAIHKWLKGSKAVKNAEAADGIEPLAWMDAETALRNIGIVG